MQRRATAEVFELFFTPRFPLFFVAGALLLSVMGNVLSDLMKGYLGDRPPRLWLILAIVTVTLAALVYTDYVVGILRARLLARHEYRVLDKPHPAKRRGLIAFPSLQQRAHLEKALDYHGDALERVWLVTTEDAKQTASDLKQKYEKGRLTVTVIPLADPWDLLTTKGAVEKIYQERLDGMAEQDVVADFTGGTKPMAVGMIFACMSPSRTLEYVPATYEGGGPKEPLDPIEYVFDARTVGILNDTSG